MFAEGIRNDLEQSALLDKQAFEKGGGPDGAATHHWESQVGNASFEVVHKARNRALVIFAVISHQAGGEFACDRPAGGLVRPLRPGLELQPYILRRLGSQITHAVGEAALTGGTRKTDLVDRLDDTGAPPEVTSSESLSPRSFMFSKNAVTV